MQDSDKVELCSLDLVKEKYRKLLEQFPEVVTEGGLIDFDRLRLSLGDAVDSGKERYGMIWPGKLDCIKGIQSPCLGTLRPCPENSLDYETTENILIEGDNLQVLKLLQKSYLGKIKMIYIDPPYNTGSDFIYPDKFSESLQTYLTYSGQLDATGKTFGTNTAADGRFHSNWLNMMYPRLYLARNLLSDDGVIFISIDDHEVHNLRRICDEVFGEENLICNFVWEKRYSPPPDTKEVGYVHENILFYRKTNNFSMGLLPLAQAQESRYKNPDNDPRGPWKPMDYTCRYTMSERPNLYYKISNPHTGKPVLPKKSRVWAFSQDYHMRNQKENRIWWGKDGKAKVPALKNFLSDIRQGMMPMTMLKHEIVGNTDEATKELRDILPDLKFTPKPVRLLKHLAIIANVSATDTVLDFFAGSGTSAVAVHGLNCNDRGHRKFIMVQLQEPTGRDDYPYITDIMRERIRGVALRLKSEDRKAHSSKQVLGQDYGFRVFKLAESNFLPWDADVPKDAKGLIKQLELHINHIREDRTADDLLYEILLKSGFPLTTPVEKLTVPAPAAAKSKKAAPAKIVYSVAGGALLICLERELTLELIRAMAELKAERVVCLDAGFTGNDQLKANAVQIFKTKGVTSFKTV